MHHWRIPGPYVGPALVLLLSPVAGLHAQDEARRETLPETTITADGDSALTTIQIEAAKKELTSIPGGTSLILEEDYRKGRAANIADILRFAPGVYIQSRFGGSETRLSVRGSGIRQTFNAVGVRILRNGLPLTESDGNTRPQLIDPLIIQHAEVLPGANGLAYGSALLGGAINFVTPTGYTADRLRIRTALGTDEYTRMQVSSGDVLADGKDYFVSGSLLDSDHFRENSDERFSNFYGNYGFPLGDDWTGRVHGTYVDSNLELPGSLTREMLEDDPRQANPSSLAVNARRDFDVARLDLEALRDLGTDESLQVGFSYQYLDMYHPLPSGRNLQILSEYALSGRYKTMTEWFGTENELVLGTYASLGDDDTRRKNINTGVKDREIEAMATTIDVYAEDRILLVEDFRLVAGAVATAAGREQETLIGPTTTDGDEDYFGLSPKLGFLWDTTPEAQVYGSVAGSFEPPTNGNLANSTQSDLDAQTAVTFEVGGRGQHSNTTWQATTYYSLVEDELLTVETPVGSGLTDTGNAEDTIHWGIELGGNQFFPLYVIEDDDGASDGIRFSAVYTYTSLEFDDDPLWGDNEIPGIPEHLLRLELLYEQPQGFYFGIDAEIASSWFVDFNNSFVADSYEVFGATTGYDFGNWRWFLDARNLANDEYASNTSITANAQGEDRAVFNPGSTFAFVTGLEFYL